jgi:hypothetical protein
MAKQMAPEASNQLDLFESPPQPAAATRAAAVAVLPADLTDDALVAAIAEATLADARGLTGEAARRRPAGAVPALAALCRRLSGFGAVCPIVEQVAALEALGSIGGQDAALAIRCSITEGWVQGPNLAAAMRAAAALCVRLPREVVLAALRAERPDLREAACDCAAADPEIVAALPALLHDPVRDVSRAAACALGRLGRTEALAPLIRELARRPTAAVIQALVPVADETAVILLGRLARERPEFRRAVIAALEDCATPLAARVLRGLPPDPGG